MKSFSITKAIKSGFSLYRNNFTLLFTASLFMSSPYFVQQIIRLKNTQSVSKMTLKEVITSDDSGKTIGQKYQELYAYAIDPLTSNTTANILIGLVTFLLLFLFSLGATRICLNLYDKKKATLSQLWSQGDKFITFVGALALIFIIFLVGTILFSIILAKIFKGAFGAPFLSVLGAFFGLSLILLPYCIIDHNKEVIASLSSVFTIIKKSYIKLPVFLIIIFCGTMILNGSIVMLVQSLITVETTTTLSLFGLFIAPFILANICSAYRQLQPAK